MNCNYCKKKIEQGLNREDKIFCDFQCLENYYIDEITSLNKSINKWKNSWFDLRERVGYLSYKFLIPRSYKTLEWDQKFNGINELYHLLDSNVWD